MTLEETLQNLVRVAVREELRAALAELAPRPAGAGDYLTASEAAALARVTRDSLRRWVSAGRLPSHRAGRELRILRSDLERFLTSGGATERKPPTAEEAVARTLARVR